DLGQVAVVGPKGVDGQGGPGWGQVHEGYPRRELIAERTHDEPDTATARDVATPHGRAAAVLLERGLEAGSSAGTDGHVVIPGGELAREHLEPLVRERRELDLVGSGEWVSVVDREAKHFPSHESLAEPGRKRGHGYEGEVALSALQEHGDIRAVDLAGADLEL